MMKITVLEKGDITTSMWGVNFVIYPYYPDEREAIILHREAVEALARDIVEYLALPVEDEDSPKSNAQAVDSFETRLSNCARCGEDHMVTYRRFTHPPQLDGDEYGWWAPCPTNGEPILMRVTQAREDPAAQIDEQATTAQSAVLDPDAQATPTADLRLVVGMAADQIDQIQRLALEGLHTDGAHHKQHILTAILLMAAGPTKFDRHWRERPWVEGMAS